MLLIKGSAFAAFSDRTLGKILFMKQLFIILIISSILISCHKDEDKTSYQTIYICSDLKSQEFKIGSYWIFNNDLTQKHDCTFVSNNSYGVNREYWGMNLITYKEYFCVFYGNSQSINGYPIDTDRIEGSNIMRNPSSSQGQFYYGPIIYSCFPDSTITYFDSLQVGNSTFYNVQKTQIDSMTCYTAKSIGIIKKVIKNSSNSKTWNLLRWKIVK
jgi:hypothetical protein